MSSVSIVVPVFKVEKYIKESIQSICMQSEQSIEIILIDDGTTDRSIELAEDILKSSRMDYQIVRQQNGGLPAARNTGLRHASGEYICFIDSDDILEKQHITRLKKCMMDDDLDVAFSEFEYTNITDRVGSVCDTENSEILSSNEIQLLFCKRKIMLHCCAMMFKRSFLEMNKFCFNEKLKFGEDVDFIWRIITFGEKVGHVYAKSYKYLIRENSIMTNQTPEKALVLRLEFKHTMQRISDENPDKKKFYDLVYNRVMLGVMHSFAAQTTKGAFHNLAIQMDSKKISGELFFFPDVCVRIISAVLYISPSLFWTIVKWDHRR